MTNPENIKPKNSAEEFYLLATKYGFKNILNKKMSSQELITFIGQEINIRNKKIDFRDVGIFTQLCRKDMINELIEIIKDIQNNNKIHLKDLEQTIDIHIQCILATCYGSLIPTKTKKSLIAINNFDKYLHNKDSDAKLLNLAEHTLRLA